MEDKLNFRTGGLKISKCHEILATSIINFIRLREREGKIGEKNPIPSYILKAELEKTILRQKYFKEEDKKHPEYLIKINQKYDCVMDAYIRKNDTKLKQKNPFYLPELVYLFGKGYIIVNKQKSVDDYEEERNDLLNAQQKNLIDRVFDAESYLDLLKGKGDVSLLDKSEDKDWEIA